MMVLMLNVFTAHCPKHDGLGDHTDPGRVCFLPDFDSDLELGHNGDDSMGPVFWVHYIGLGLPRR